MALLRTWVSTVCRYLTGALGPRMRLGNKNSKDPIPRKDEEEIQELMQKLSMAGEAQLTENSELMVVEFPDKTRSLAVPDRLTRVHSRPKFKTPTTMQKQLSDPMVIVFQFPIYLCNLTFWNSVAITFPPSSWPPCSAAVNKYYETKKCSVPSCGVRIRDVITQKHLYQIKLQTWVEEDKDMTVQQHTNGNNKVQCERCAQDSSSLGHRLKCVRVDGKLNLEQITFQGPGHIYIGEKLQNVGLNFDLEMTVQRTPSKHDECPLLSSDSQSVFKQEVRFKVPRAKSDFKQLSTEGEEATVLEVFYYLREKSKFKLPVDPEVTGQKPKNGLSLTKFCSPSLKTVKGQPSAGCEILPYRLKPLPPVAVKDGKVA